MSNTSFQAVRHNYEGLLQSHVCIVQSSTCLERGDDHTFRKFIILSCNNRDYVWHSEKRYILDEGDINSI